MQARRSRRACRRFDVVHIISSEPNHRLDSCVTALFLEKQGGETALMAESFPEIVSDRADDAGKYQPLAPLAIASIIAAGLLGIATVTLLLIGLFAGKRVLELPLVFGAIAGIALAVAARWQVRKSEGARTGVGLANVAWWISLVCGLVYGAYYLGTMLSIRAQAQEFLDASWYPSMRKPDTEAAFFYTRTPLDRHKRTPKAVIERFADHYLVYRRMELVHVIDRSQGELLVESEGFTQEEERQQQMVLQQSFVIRSREGWFRSSVSVVRSTTKELEGAQYHAFLANPSIRERRLSTYGRLIREISTEGGMFVREWAIKSSGVQQVPTFLDTQELSTADRKKYTQDYSNDVYVKNPVAAVVTPFGGLANAYQLCVTLGDTEINRAVMTPAAFRGYADKLITIKESTEHKGPALQQTIRERLLTYPSLTPPMSLAMCEVPNTLEIRSDEIRVGLPMECRFPPLGLVVEGKIYATLRSPEALAEINRLRQMDWRTLSDQEDTTPGGLLDRFQRTWVVTQVYVDLSTPVIVDTPGPNQTPAPPSPGSPRTKKK
jgi:hypothetical protein